MRRSTLQTFCLALLFALVGTACTINVPDSTSTIGDGGTSTTTTTTVSPPPDDGETSTTTTSTVSPPPDGGGGGTGDGDGQTLDPAVVSQLASFGPWMARDVGTFEDDRDLEPYDFVTADRVKVTCGLSDRAIPAKVFEEFAAFPFSGDKLPGLIVQGNGIEAGDLQVLPLERAPLPLVVNLATEAPSVVVDDPDPSTLQGAVSELVRTADARLTGLPVVPANIRFYHREVSSYEEAVLNMGVSLRYESGSFEGKFKSEFEQSQSSERHTVMARLLQPMFTISADKSSIVDPGDYFAASTTTQEVNALVAQNRLGPDNPPVLIDAVTYGRVVYMTVTSDKVTSADELKIAVSGAYGGFSGDAEVANKNRRIMNESEIKVEAFGGDDDVALEALKTGTIQGFMESVNTSTAAPLSMVLRTLDGRMLSVTDSATVTDIGCTREAIPNDIKVQITTGNSTWGTLSVNGAEITTVKANQTRVLTLSQLSGAGNGEVKIVYQPPTCIGGSMTVSFLVNDRVYQGKQWRIAGNAGEWACTETGTWTVNKQNGTVSLTSGPAALRLA